MGKAAEGGSPRPVESVPQELDEILPLVAEAIGVLQSRRGWGRVEIAVIGGEVTEIATTHRVRLKKKK